MAPFLLRFSRKVYNLHIDYIFTVGQQDRRREHMSSFGSVAELADIYREGRNLAKPSLALVNMGGAPGIPVEIVLKHIPDDHELGAFWYDDIRKIMDLAEIEFDDEAKNPNLKFLGAMFREMTKMRHDLVQPLPVRDKPKIPAAMQKFSL